MLHFFDFVFYKTYKKYIGWGEKDIPGIYALCLITLLPCLNISSLIFICIDVLEIKTWNYSEFLILLFFLLVMGLNYYRIFIRIGLINLLRKWDSVLEQKRSKLSFWMVIYIIVTILVLFATII